MNDNMSRMFCTKINLLVRKSVLKVFIISNFLLLETPVKLRNSQIRKKLSTLIKTELFKFLSSFCLYLWDTHDSKNISEVHGSSYFYRLGKTVPCHILFSFSKMKLLL